jgi:hypothetical protein
MESDLRSHSLGANTRQRLIVLAGAALLTALLFGGLFEGAAHLTNWILTSQAEHFVRRHPLLNVGLTVIMPLIWMLAAAAIGISRSWKTRPHRAIRRRMGQTLGL